jgi:hypothetical protein
MAGPRARPLAPLLAALIGLIGYVVLLAVVPRLVPMHVPPGIVSAAAAQGYNTQAAFWTALLWSLAIVAAGALFLRGTGEPAAQGGGEGPPGRLLPGELALVFVVFALAYFPVFLARNGPYMEDEYFVTAMSRMACGQLPYRDFDFSYGPWMIYPLWGWTRLFGATLSAYYGFLAVLQGLQFALLMGALQLFVTQRWRRWAIFLVLLPFLLNTLLGLNEDGFRRIPAMLVLLVAAARPFDWRANLACALVLGFQLGYSEEFALAALVGVGAIYGSLLFGPDRIRALRSGALVGAGALLAWAGLSALITGGTFGDYLHAMLGTMSRMSAGHAGFRFGWTLNALAVFALLGLACALVGAALGRGWTPLRTGDRMLLGALVFGLVILKSGLDRSDLWHLHAVTLALMLAFLLELPTAAVAVDPLSRRTALALTLVASVTFLIGILPTGSLYAAAYLQGLKEVAARQPLTAQDPGASRVHSLEYERTHPRPLYTALGRYLAEPERAKAPVLFYGRAWVAAPLVGVCSQDYKLDDVMYYDLDGPERLLLERHPDAVVVMDREDYERVFGLAPPNQAPKPAQLTLAKKLAVWLSTDQYGQGPIENRLQNQIRDRLTGDYVRRNFRLARDFGDDVVVERNSSVP